MSGTSSHTAGKYRLVPMQKLSWKGCIKTDMPLCLRGIP